MTKKANKDLPMTISVSRNVLGAASSFDTFELNIIIILLDILRPFMYVSNILPDPGEFFLRFSSITDRHVVREELKERINKLRQKDIRYIMTAPGVQLKVITGLFSSVVETTGGVIARVSAEAIPWLLYIGRGVGYAQFEPGLFIKMSSVYHKRLYCLLCAKAYKGITTFTISRERLYMALGIPERTPVYDVQKRYLAGFRDYLEKQCSMYSFTFDSVVTNGSKAGRPAIGSFGVVFNMRPEYLEQKQKHDPNFESFLLLRKLMPILKKRLPGIRAVSDIHNELVEKNYSQAFVQAMSAYSKQTDEHQANTLPMVLKDRYEIDVFSGQDSPGDDEK